jgi:folate-binding protein YgfZ
MDRSPLLEPFRARGTRLSERPEAPGRESALLFGDVPAEYRAARAGCALLDAGDRGRVTARGPDAADFLHRLLANHVKSLGPGSGNANLLLSPKGKVLFDFDLARHPEHFELSTPPGRGPALREALERYRFSERLELTDTSAGHAPIELEGPAASAVLARILAAPTPELAPHAWRALPWAGGTLELVSLGAQRWRLDAGPARALELWDALRTAGATPCGLVVRDSLRVEAGRALFGVDVDENVYPQEAGLETAFALDKGCYVGQEVVAKIDTYGGLNKRLLCLRVDHSDPVARGTRLFRDDDGERRELGLVTSWAYSFALDGGLVLAYVKRRHQEPGTAFDLVDAAETVRGRATIVPAPGGDGSPR